MTPEQPIVWRLLLIVPAVALFLALLFGALFTYQRYTGLTRGNAWLVLLASIVGGAVRSFYTAEAIKPVLRSSNSTELVLRVVAAGFFIVFVTAFVLRLWGRWIGENATEEERLPGAPGIRAWFSTSNLFVGFMLVLTAWLGYNTSPVLAGSVVVALLAVYPLVRLESPATASGPAASSPASAPRTEDLSAEREKIVSMLEAGKLTAEESAELLQALGESSRSAAPRQVPLTGSQRLLLIGAALVAIGFFLPWFVINPGKEAGRLMKQMQQFPKTQMNMTIPGFERGSVEIPTTTGFPFGQGLLQDPSLSFSGGDIQRGLGWATLLLALAAALLPYVAVSMDAATTRVARLLCLGVGGLIVLYLVTQNFRFVGIGLVIAVSGYVVAITGALRERLSANA